MGQRQAVPLLRPERPLVGTGLETQVARDSGMVPITRVNGEVVFVDSTQIIVRDAEGLDHYHLLQKYQRSNQEEKTKKKKKKKKIPGGLKKKKKKKKKKS